MHNTKKAAEDGHKTPQKMSGTPNRDETGGDDGDHDGHDHMKHAREGGKTGGEAPNKDMRGDC